MVKNTKALVELNRIGDLLADIYSAEERRVEVVNVCH